MWGVVFWIAFSALIVLLRGVRWDEHWDLAQVILGRIHYPPDHFLSIWTRQVRNAPILISTALAWLTPGPGAVNGFRNILWLLSATLPPYLVGVVLTRRPLCGHVAALFVLFGLYVTFDANYPLYAWPAYFSNGHIGMGYALAAFALLLAGKWRMAAFLIGFMPTVHIAHLPPVAVAALAMAAWRWRKGRDMAVLGRALPWALPGAAVCVILWLLPTGVEAPQSGPYAGTGDWEPIVQAYMAQATHWAAPGVTADFVNSNFILAATLLLAAGAARGSLSNSEERDSWIAISVYIASCALAVWGMMILQTVFGDRLPYLLVAAMPYRLANHAAVLAIPILAAILLAPKRNAGAPPWAGYGLVALALLHESIKHFVGPALSPALYNRYLADGDGTVYALAGAAAVLVAVRFKRDTRWIAVWACLWITVLAVTGMKHQFGVACFVSGTVIAALATFVTTVGRRSDTKGNDSGVPRRIVALAATMACVLIVVQEIRYREMLPVADFDQRIARYLEQQGDTGAMLAAHPFEHRIQSRTGHPVLFDGASADSMVYTPALAPSIQKISEDLYGIRFHPQMEPGAPSWDEVWRGRPREIWLELGQNYGFSYVLSPDGVQLDLDVCLSDPKGTLYRIPPVTRAGPGPRRHDEHRPLAQPTAHRLTRAPQSFYQGSARTEWPGLLFLQRRWHPFHEGSRPSAVRAAAVFRGRQPGATS